MDYYGTAYNQRGALKSDTNIKIWSANPNELQLSAYYGRIDALKRILREERVGVQDLNTALMMACVNDQIGAVRILVDRGADVNHHDHLGIGLVHAASSRGHSNIVKYLVERGALQNDRVEKICKYWCVVPGDSPLHFACKGLAAADKSVRALLALGADPNARNALGQTPLHCAVSQPIFPKKAELLLSVGADPNAVDARGASPIHYTQTLEALATLVLFGADIDKPTANGKRALQLCRRRYSHVLLFGGGVRVRCAANNCNCATTVLMCVYRSAVEELKRGPPSPSNGSWTPYFSYYDALIDFNYISEYFTLASVAGISLGDENRPSEERDLRLLLDRREESFDDASFKNACSAEFAKMDSVIPGTLATYKGVFFQRPSALRDPNVKKILTLKHCTLEFPHYGTLLYARSILGQRKLPLINECFEFFTATLGYSNFPERCMEDILSNLEEKDLQCIATLIK